MTTRQSSKTARRGPTRDPVDQDAPDAEQPAPDLGPKTCASDEDCDDQSPCTTDVCGVGGECKQLKFSTGDDVSNTGEGVYFDDIGIVACKL